MLTLSQICTAIETWENSRSSLGFLQVLFATNNSFMMTGNSDYGNNTYMHAYPGILNGTFVFFYIPNLADTQQQYDTPEGILPFIEYGTVQYNTIPNSVNGELAITRQEALARIALWENDHDTWLANEVQNGGVYQAFTIPIGDVKPGMNISYFALNPDTTSNVVNADLMVWDDVNGSAQGDFEDVVRPVPPYGSGPIDSSAFFLLNLALQ